MTTEGENSSEATTWLILLINFKDIIYKQRKRRGKWNNWVLGWLINSQAQINENQLSSKPNESTSAFDFPNFLKPELINSADTT